MRGKRFAEERMIGALNRHENGEKVADICRELGIAQQTFYRWKSKYGGKGMSAGRRESQFLMLPAASCGKGQGAQASAAGAGQPLPPLRLSDAARLAAQRGCGG